jgi:hypothetical protein
MVYVEAGGDQLTQWLYSPRKFCSALPTISSTPGQQKHAARLGLGSRMRTVRRRGGAVKIPVLRLAGSFAHLADPDSVPGFPSTRPAHRCFRLRMEPFRVADRLGNGLEH